MLAQLATIISSEIQPQDILARLGGDEFGIILKGRGEQEAIATCERIIRVVSNYRLIWKDSYYSVGASIGIVPVSNTYTYIELLSIADLACYKAKDLGRGKAYFTTGDDSALSDEQLQIGYIANLNQSLETNRFYFAKQRIAPINKEHEEPPKYELLLRYSDAQGNTVPPGIFIPVAEKHGLITLIDKWVIKNCIYRYNELFGNEGATVSINVSGVSLSDSDFLSDVLDIVKNTDIDMKKICFEITETAVVSHISKAQEFIQELKKYGCQFSLDDFGSGSSSYSYLKQLPVDYLKIDGSLIRSIDSEFIDRSIVRSINDIAHQMNIQTIAEFVENRQIVSVLEKLGIDYAQGYGIHKPELC